MGCFASNENRALLAFAPGVGQMPQPPSRDRDDIIAHGAICKVRAAGQKQPSRPDNPLTRAVRYGLHGGVGFAPGFDLNESEHPSTLRHQIDLTLRRPVAGREDRISF